MRELDQSGYCQLNLSSIASIGNYKSVCLSLFVSNNVDLLDYRGLLEISACHNYCYGEVRELDQSGYCQLNLSSIESIGNCKSVCLSLFVSNNVDLLDYRQLLEKSSFITVVIAIESLYLYLKENTINYKFN